jgi:hypothetical protein
VGDYLLSIGDIPVTERSFATRFRQKYRTEGAAVPITVQRGNEAVALSGKLRFEERMEMHVTADPKATPKAARIRAGILHGITEK